MNQFNHQGKPGRINPEEIKIDKMNKKIVQGQEAYDLLFSEVEQAVQAAADKQEKEIWQALKVLKSAGVYAIKTIGGKSLGIDYLLSFKHPWDEEEK